MNAANGVAAVIVLAITLYAFTGIADFGAGLWDFLAGGRDSGRRTRALIDEVVTPVWESNHVWLIFILVTCWTGFGVAIGAIMTTMFVPLALAALGIVLRGANFALRKDAARVGGRHVAGWLFGLGSVLTPFFLGAVIGGIVAGRVPPDGSGDPVTSWWNATSVTVGLLTVSIGAFLSAIYLVIEAKRRGFPEFREYFRVRALVAGAIALLCGIAVSIALHADSAPMFERFTSRSLPLIIIGVLALAATFVMAARGATRGLRVLAALGVAALVWSWAIAQSPYLLPFGLTISAGAGANTSMKWVLAWFVVALVTVVPLIVLLFVLEQRGELGEDPTTSRLDTAPAGGTERAG